MTDRKILTKTTENAFTALNQNQLQNLKTETSEQIQARIDKIASEQPHRRLTCYCAFELNWYETVGALDVTTFIEMYFPISRQEAYKEKSRASIELVIFKGDFSKIGSIKASHLDLLHKEAKHIFIHNKDKHAFYQGVWTLALEHQTDGKRQITSLDILSYIKKYIFAEENLESKLTREEQIAYIESTAPSQKSSHDQTDAPTSPKSEKSIAKTNKNNAKIISKVASKKVDNAPEHKTKEKNDELKNLEVVEKIKLLSNQVSEKDKVFWVQKWVCDLLLRGTDLHILLTHYQKSTSSKKLKKQLKKSLRKYCHH